MSHNPYSAPAAMVEDVTPETFSWRVVLLALVVGFGVFELLSMPVYLIAQYWYAARVEGIGELYRAVFNSPGYLFAVLALELPSTAASVYVLIRMKPQRPYVHATVVAVFCFVFGLLIFLDLFPNPYPAWWMLIYFLSIIPLYLACTWYYLRRQARDDDA